FPSIQITTGRGNPPRCYLLGEFRTSKAMKAIEVNGRGTLAERVRWTVRAIQRIQRVDFSRAKPTRTHQSCNCRFRVCACLAAPPVIWSTLRTAPREALVVIAA